MGNYTNSKKIKISLIISNYNNGPFLADCIESALDQEYGFLEIIIVDDASTDDSKKIIKKYCSKFKFIKALFNSKNRGVSYTRHAGILQSTGDYLTTLDSDDYFCNKNKIKKEVELMKFHWKKYNNIVIPFSDFILFDVDKKKFNKISDIRKIKEGKILYHIITRSCFIPRDFIMKRSMYFYVGGYDIHIPLYEDWDLKIRLSSKYDFYYSKTDGIIHRLHKKGLSSAKIIEHNKWLNYVFKKNLKLISYNLKLSAMFNFYSHYYIRLLKNL